MITKMNYNVTGSGRKRLIAAIEGITGYKARYLYMPTKAYEIGDIMVEADGTVVVDSEDVYTAQALAGRLAFSGFSAVGVEHIGEDNSGAFEDEAAGVVDSDVEALDGYAEAGDDEEVIGGGEAAAEQAAGADADATGLSISIPDEGCDEACVARLEKIIASKESLLKKALGADSLSVLREDGKLVFPWFDSTPDAEVVKACGNLIKALMAMARNSKRVTAKEKDTDNAKYAMRCFLLRLGFIGPEYKAARKVLLRNLDGSGAFRHGKPAGQVDENE